MRAYLHHVRNAAYRRLPRGFRESDIRINPGYEDPYELGFEDVVHCQQGPVLQCKIDFAHKHSYFKRSHREVYKYIKHPEISQNKHSLHSKKRMLQFDYNLMKYMDYGKR